MVFDIKFIYKSAIDYAREKELDDIRDLISNGPNPATRKQVERIFYLHREKIAEMKKRLEQKSRILNLEEQLHEYEYLNEISTLIKSILE